MYHLLHCSSTIWRVGDTMARSRAFALTLGEEGCQAIAVGRRSIFASARAGPTICVESGFNMRRPAVHIHGHLGSRTPGAAPSPECWRG